jgi:uncharacterized protein YjiS (DUF1127 family)
MQKQSANQFVELLRRLVQAARGLSRRRTSVNEIACLEPRELACIAHDLGISPDELYVLAAQDKSAADLLLRRMETLRLDPRQVDSAVMRDLQRCCSQCKDKVLCVHELEDRPREATWPKYCPNSQTLAALTEERVMRNTPASSS